MTDKMRWHIDDCLWFEDRWPMNLALVCKQPDNEMILNIDQIDDMIEALERWGKAKIPCLE